MKFRRFFVTPRHARYAVMTTIAFALSACATAATSAPVVPPAVQPLPATATPTDLSTAVNPQATVAIATQVVEVQAVATSRGPNLEATDPSTVSLAAGQLQLVEFFRFT